MDPGKPADFREYAERVLDVLEAYLRESREGAAPVIDLRPLSRLSAELDLEGWLGRGGMDASALGDFVARYLAWTTRLHHPGFLAHQVAVPHFASALADLVNGVTNNGMAIYEMGPPAVALELSLVRWMLSKVGWRGSGVLTHGGSLANLTALLAARARACPDAWDRGLPGDLAVLAPASCHYSVARAVSILGLGSEALYRLPVDGKGVVIPDRVPGAYRRVIEDGRRVMAVTANACATSTGLYDPLEEIGRFCREEGLWFHVDGAHGASALLSGRLRRHLRGVEHADSLVWDAHKMLQTSVLCAAALFRDEGAATDAFRQEASYFAGGSDPERVNLYDRALECTKTGLGLKLFLVLAARGEAALARHVEELCDRTATFYDLIAARPGFHCPYRPQANILCFRYGDDDGRQERIRQRLIEEGDFYVSSVVVGGRRHLRLCVMNPATDEGCVLRLLERVEAAAG